MSASVYIGFGSNMGDRKKTFFTAVAELRGLPGTTVGKCSRLYETEPVGLADGGNRFLNAVIRLETSLSPTELAAAMRKIEARLGKSPDHRSDESRTIDLDLLLYAEKEVRTDNLEIPHPRMHQRGFVLVPLTEIAAEAYHPVLKCTAEALLRRISREEIAQIAPLEESLEAET